MSRARGKHNAPRQPAIDPDSGEGREIGMSKLTTQDSGGPIPGGDIHITRQPVERQKAAVSDASPLEHGGWLAHGVPPDTHTFYERAEHERGPNDLKQPVPKYAPLPEKPRAIPVQIEQTAKIYRVATSIFTVPANTAGQSIKIADRDPDRRALRLLVETAAGSAGAAPTGIRIDHEISSTDTGRGALVRAGGTSYLKIETNDSLYALSNDGSACTISVIYEYGIEETG